MFRPTWSSSGAQKIDVKNCYTFVNGYDSKIYFRLCAHVLLLLLLLYVCSPGRFLLRVVEQLNMTRKKNHVQHVGA
jgi:hypothetical protein